MDTIQQSYESVPYPHYIHPLSDPARLAAIGRILGLAAVDPAGARVLDIGCGAGTNLLAMAARFPAARFTGIDFSGPDIASASALATEAGLANVTFTQADVRTWEPGEARFDFIIAYGLFSWVPDEVKDALLALIRRCLAPQGIACVAFMTYPGCKQAEALRDLLRMRTQAASPASDRVDAAHATLDFLERAWSALPTASQSDSLREAAHRIRAKEPHFLLLDDLGIERDPLYLTQFAQWAGRHGLRYLGDSEYHTMLPDNLPPESARELAAMKLGAVETGQMIDFVVNRTFRAGLLVGADAVTAGPGPHPQALRDLCLSTSLRPDVEVARTATEASFVDRDGRCFTMRSIPLVAALHALSERPEARIPFRGVLAEAQSAAGRPLTAAEESRLLADLLALYGRECLELSTQSFIPPSVLASRPRLTPLNAALARRRSLLATAGQQSISLSDAQRAFCGLLDGEHDLATLRLAETSAQLGGDLERYLRWLAQCGCLDGAVQE
jgi:SAM-dependent methyltransferase